MVAGALALLGRFAFCAIFLGSAVHKIVDFEGSRAFMAEHGMPWTAPLLVCAILLELLGGTCILLGFQVRLGALLLLAFLVPATVVFHLEQGSSEQLVHLLKNFALLGVLLMILAGGVPGPALDRIAAPSIAVDGGRAA